MSQIEQKFSEYLAKHPEIEKCYSYGLINRRALARYLIQKTIAKPYEIEAVIAMLRRYKFREAKEEKTQFKGIKTSLKDNMAIIVIEKNKDNLDKLRDLVKETKHEKGETVKIVMGTSYITLITDQEKKIEDSFKLKSKQTNVSEISLKFSDQAINAKGILSYVTRELFLHNVVISELLTASNELLIYVKESNVLKAYEVIKGMK